MSLQASVAGILTTVIVGAGAASVGIQEGSKESYMEEWMIGRSSSQWRDDNRDRAKTTITLTGCSTSYVTFENTSLLLLEDGAGPMPDTEKGTKTFTQCHKKSEQESWKRVPAGDYSFRLVEINKIKDAHTRIWLSAKKVRMAW